MRDAVKVYNSWMNQHQIKISKTKKTKNKSTTNIGNK